jgi:predicted O-linked N-acetylglucosamine transferase (SPINDLY family)
LTLDQAIQYAQQSYAGSDWATAEQLCRLILEAEPAHVEALNLLAIMYAQSGHYAAAAQLLQRLVQAQPQNPHMHSNYGNVLKELKQHEQALACFDRAIALDARLATAHYNRGNVLQEQGQLAAAITSFDHAIALEPGLAQAHCNRGIALKDLKQWDAAIASLDRAIAAQPQHAQAHYNRGVALQELKQLTAAIASYDQAIAHQPDHAQAHCNRGNALLEVKQLEAAVASFDRALAIQPDFAPAHSNRGVALQALEHWDAALRSYDQAIALQPDYAEAYFNRGQILQELKRMDEALACYAQAIKINPAYEFLFDQIVQTKTQSCDWHDLDNHLKKLADRLLIDAQAVQPFAIATTLDAPALQKLASDIFAKSQFPASTALGLPTKRHPASKIKIGYYSADFHDHATTHLMAGVFDWHDKAKFEIIAFSFGPDKPDAMRARIAAACTQFINLNSLSDQEAAQLSRSLGIDIAVDLKGYTHEARPGIFAHRCAPIQVNYLGYPGTMGADYMDYLIADPVVIPETHRPFYAEKIVSLPGSYQANDGQRNISDKTHTKAELGLPASGFVFCCFNNNYKIMPTWFDGWMRILSQVPGSVLWLLGSNPTAIQNLRQEAELRGIHGARLIFAPRMPNPEHLARHQLADLFLDTLPCNAHTTASDALWAGLPVLTCMGQSFPSRVAGSLLHALHLPELVTTTQQAYEALAVRLATQPAQLASLRAKLAQQRKTAPLFDTARFTRNLEAAYTAMHQRYLADLPPDHISLT